MSSNSPILLGEKVVLFRSVLPLCSDLIERAETYEWRHNEEIRDRYETVVDLNGLEPISKEIYKAIEAYGNIYEYNSHNVSPEIDSLDISKYLDGSHVGPHTDEDIAEDTGEATLLAYLNDDYLYGDLFISKSGIRIKPKVGDIIIMSCHLEHYTQPCEGIKYIGILKINYTK